MLPRYVLDLKVVWWEAKGRPVAEPAAIRS